MDEGRLGLRDRDAEEWGTWGVEARRRSTNGRGKRVGGYGRPRDPIE